MKNNNFTERFNFLLEHKCDGNRSKMAREMKVSVENIRNYAKGREPNLSFLVALKQKFKVSFEWLLLSDEELENMPESSNAYGLEQALKDKERIINLLEDDNKRLKKEVEDVRKTFQASKKLS